MDDGRRTGPSRRDAFEAAFFADLEFSEETIYPDGGLAIPAGTVMPISPERKYWAAVEYMVPNFMNLDGNLWTRLSYSYQSEVWKSTGAIADWVDATTPEERAAARELLLPSYSTGTLLVMRSPGSCGRRSPVRRSIVPFCAFSR